MQAAICQPFISDSMNFARRTAECIVSGRFLFYFFPFSLNNGKAPTNGVEPIN